MRFQVLAVALAMALTLATACSALASDDGGKSVAGLWSVRFTPDAATTQPGRRGFNDRLLFDGTGLTAEAFAMYGFASSELSVASDGSFSTSMANETQVTVTFSGQATADHISGTMTWIRDDKTLRFEFCGARQR